MKANEKYEFPKEKEDIYILVQIKIQKLKEK